MIWPNELLELDDADASVPGCFLCAPDPDLVYAESPSFVAMLGLGPIGEGYSLIAAREHVPSMFDLDPESLLELNAFTKRVRARLRPHYGSALVTEHGRVAPCLSRLVRVHEPHCLHAHRLVFPGIDVFDLAGHAPWIEVSTFSDSSGAARAHPSGQYLFAETEGGKSQVAIVSGPFPRQFFRRVVATDKGSQHLADWSMHPGWPLVHAARRRLRE